MTLLRIGPLALDLQDRSIWRDGSRIDVQPLAYDLLAYAAQRPGQLLERDELHQELWPDIAVTDHSLTQLVHRIRSLLGENRGWWKTVPKRGYRFEAPISEESSRGDEATQSVNAPISADFHGRESELAQLATLLGPGGGPVLVHGPGGAGKSRLCHEFSRSAVGSWTEVLWIDFSADTTAIQVLTRLASALDIPVADSDIPAMQDQIGRGVSHRARALIIIDNLEQLDSAAREALGACIAAAPNQAWLATARDLIDLPRSQRLHLPPLPAQASHALFVRRAGEAGVDLKQADHPDLDEIIVALEGSPLAIELAAARTPMLGLHGVRTRLKDSLSLLAGRRSGPPRHRSITAAISWSWDLLDRPQQRVLLACALFPETFTVAQIEGVVAESNGATPVLDALQTLREHCLIPRSGPSAGDKAGRMRLARPVHQFGVQALADHDDGEALIRGLRLTMRRTITEFAPLLDEWDRIRAAQARLDLPAAQWAFATHGVDADRPWTERLACLWKALGRPDLAREWLSRWGPMDDGCSLRHRKLWMDVGPNAEVSAWLATEPWRSLLTELSPEMVDFGDAISCQLRAQGDLDKSAELDFALLAWAESNNDSVRAVTICIGMATTEIRKGAVDQAGEWADRAFSLGLTGVHPALQASVYDLRGYVYGQQGDVAQGRRYSTKAVGIARREGLDIVLCRTLSNLGSTVQEAGFFAESLVYMDEAIDRLRAMGTYRLECHALIGRSLTHLHLEQIDLARADLERLKSNAEGPFPLVYWAMNAAALACHEGEWLAAVMRAQDGLSTIEDRPLVAARSAILLWLAVGESRRGHADLAQSAADTAAALPAEDSPDFLHAAWAAVVDDLAGRAAANTAEVHPLVALVHRVLSRWPLPG